MIQPGTVKIGSCVLYQVPGVAPRHMFVKDQEWDEASRVPLLVCEWLDDDGNSHEGRFVLEALDLAPDRNA